MVGNNLAKEINPILKASGKPWKILYVVFILVVFEIIYLSFFMSIVDTILNLRTNLGFIKIIQ